jgi:hypothetical protein
MRKLIISLAAAAAIASAAVGIAQAAPARSAPAHAPAHVTGDVFAGGRGWTIPTQTRLNQVPKAKVNP